MVGELLTRGWDTLPLPDLSLTAQDASGVILEICAIRKSHGGAPAVPSSNNNNNNATRWQHQGQQQQQQQQQRTYPQQYHPSSAQHAQQGSHDGYGGMSHRGAIGMVSRDHTSTDYSNNKKDTIHQSRKRDRWASDSDSDREYSRDRSRYGDDDGSQGGPFSADEESRRRRRAGRFKDGAADGVKLKGQGKKGGSSAARRARLNALLDDAGAGGDDVDWDAFAIKVRGHSLLVISWLIINTSTVQCSSGPLVDINHVFLLSVVYNQLTSYLFICRTVGYMSDFREELFPSHVCPRPFNCPP